MEPAALLVSDLWTGYGKHPAVQEAALEVGAAEFVAIVGPNGAGKSTLIGALAGVLPSWRGGIRWQERDITRTGPAERVGLGISTVPQGAPSFPGATVARNLQIAAGIRHAGDRSAIPLVFELFPELVSRQQIRAGSLSGGERQMLALARAICQQPRLILLDEPSFGLAIGVRHRVIEMLAEYRQRSGCAVLIVEQDIRMIETASRVYFMASGKLERVR